MKIKNVEIKNAVPGVQLVIGAILTVVAAALADGLNIFETLIRVLQLPEVLAFIQGIVPGELAGLVAIVIAFVASVLKWRIALPAEAEDPPLKAAVEPPESKKIGRDAKK